MSCIVYIKELTLIYTAEHDSEPVAGERLG